MLTEILEIVSTPKILGLSELRGPRLKPFQPNGKSAPGYMFSGFTSYHYKFHLRTGTGFLF